MWGWASDGSHWVRSNFFIRILLKINTHSVTTLWLSKGESRSLCPHLSMEALAWLASEMILLLNHSLPIVIPFNPIASAIGDFFNRFALIWINSFANNYSLFWPSFFESNLTIFLTIFFTPLFFYRVIISSSTVMFAALLKCAVFCSGHTARISDKLRQLSIFSHMS